MNDTDATGRRPLAPAGAEATLEPAAAPSTAGRGTAADESALPDDALPIVAVRDTVLFPGTVFPVAIGRESSVLAAQQALRAERPIGILMQRDADTAEPGAADLHPVGTIANILRYVNVVDGAHHLVVQGLQRFRVDRFVREQPFLAARVLPIEEPEAQGAEIEARLLNLKQQAMEALQVLPQVPQPLIEAVQASTSPGALADLMAAYLDLSRDERQEVLETIDLRARADKVSVFLAKRIEVMRLSQEIGKRTKASLDERQREAILREQLATIQRELGDGDGRAMEVAELAKAIDAAQLPDEVRELAKKELRRYERMSDGAPEAGMVRTYLDWLIELPWAEPEPRAIDLAEARRVLDEDHFGLDKIKQRIIEFLAVRKLAPGGKAPILCFVGPPGTGKTSLGQSIARAMHRPFARVSLGGVHDEAEIRGHRRTYIGSMPGHIIQAIRKAKSRDCVMMLDEIDKMDRGIQGDPSAALLEVLDPEQNGTFRDNYLGVPFDLSRIVFITTDNLLDTVPGPLRDRMEIIALTSYTCRGADRRRHGPATGDWRRRLARVPGPAAFRERNRHAYQHPGRGHRPGLDAGGRRHPVHRGRHHAGQGGTHPDRAARRRDARERAGGVVHRQAPRQRAGHRRGAPGQDRHPRARAGRRHAQGRAQRRRGHVHRAGVVAHRSRGAQRHGHDRRDQPARAGAAGGRHQGKNRGSRGRGSQARDAAGAQSARL